MHETVIAQQVLRAILAAMEQRGATAVKAIDVEIGQLEALGTKELQAAFDIVAKGTPAEDAVLQVKLIPATGFCRSCSEERPFEIPRTHGHGEPLEILCPECGSPLELRGGRGFTVQRATMVLEDP
ncbi:MAG TPA: hydrogenase maturation nickel metallochaperone HypA [Thermoplasmata archaeon]|jgi:hydrogenase nickel incorporation protein HypA/HybF